MPKLNVLVAGSTGYIGVQLIKLLVKHNKINIKYLCGSSSVGKSISSYEKTLKNKMRAMTGDFWVIDNISLYSNYLDIAILPDGFILDDYKDHFDQFLEEIELDEKYHYTPTLFAHDYYGAAELDFLVLYFADMSTLFDFKTKTIKVLPITSLTDLNRLIFSLAFGI